MLLNFGKFKGSNFEDTPAWYQKWLLNQSWFKLSSDPEPPKRPSHWDGHSRSGQSWESAHFEYEKAMDDIYDPVDKYEY